MSLESVQKKIKYEFANPEHLNLALTAAHRSDLDGIANDGNRGLSQMGLSVLGMVETYHTVFVEKGTQSKFCSINFCHRSLSRLELANTRESWIRSKQDRAKACKKLGIHQHVVRSVRQQHEEPSSTVLANTLSAIFGAIWIDMLEKKGSGLDIIEQISAVLQYVDSVVASEPTLGHLTGENGDFPTLEENEGIPESSTPG
jgi:dsRNA-specific ribonuclease